MNALASWNARRARKPRPRRVLKAYRCSRCLAAGFVDRSHNAQTCTRAAPGPEYRPMAVGDDRAIRAWS